MELTPLGPLTRPGTGAAHRTRYPDPGLGSEGMIRRLVMIAFLALSVSAFAGAPVSRMVNVNGASLEYLDWGGSGPPLVFLAGLSDTPYIYNELASEFTSQFHCYGLTRRGHGRSESAGNDYSLEAMVSDV